MLRIKSWIIILISITILAAISGCISQQESTAESENHVAKNNSPNWQISVNTSGNWTAEIIDDISNRNNYSGKNSEIFYHNNTKNITISVTLEDKDKYVTLKLKQIDNNVSDIYGDSGIGSVSIRNNMRPAQLKPIILSLKIHTLYNWTVSDIAEQLGWGLEQNGFRVLPPGSDAKVDTLFVDYKELSNGKEYDIEKGHLEENGRQPHGFILEAHLQFRNVSRGIVLEKTIRAETPEKVNCDDQFGGSNCLHDVAGYLFGIEWDSFIDSELILQFNYSTEMHI